MIVLHASFRNNHLRIWGESPSEGSNGKARNGVKYAAEGLLSPFDAGQSALLEGIGGQAPVNGKRRPAETMVAWLPSVADGPCPSSPLIDGVAANGSVTLRPWRVTTIELGTIEATEFLCACICASSVREPLKPGVVVGSSLG